MLNYIINRFEFRYASVQEKLDTKECVQDEKRELTLKIMQICFMRNCGKLDITPFILKLAQTLALRRAFKRKKKRPQRYKNSMSILH